MDIKPSQLKNWDEIDHSKANLQFTGGRPELYSWYEKNGTYYAHRKPNTNEILNDEINNLI